LAASASDALPSSFDSPSPPAFDWRDLVDFDLWDQVPADVPELLGLLSKADLYVQDEVEIRLHPTLTRCWSPIGHHGQRLVRAPGQSSKVVGFVAADWRNGWLSHGIALGRTADVYCRQIDHLVCRSQERGRVALVLADNLGIHTRRGSKKLREAADLHGDQLCLVYTPTYDPQANPTERLFPPFRHKVTHNHHHDTLFPLYEDARRYFADLDHTPDTVLRHLGSPFVHVSQAAT
jgi:DDE superfamily endonuclease